jgi:ribosomal-protein-alanine N-acetyltransferase
MSGNPKQSSSTEMSENLKSLIIEEMKKEDLNQVMEIEEKSFSDPWRESFFSQDIDNESAMPLIARSNDRVVGYVCLWKILDEIQISNIAVAPQLRRRGIGEKMIEKILKIAQEKDYRRITLDVRISNLPAINLYKKLGFSEAGRRKNYYRLPQEDALIMEKILK